MTRWDAKRNCFGGSIYKFVVNLRALKLIVKKFWSDLYGIRPSSVFYTTVYIWRVMQKQKTLYVNENSSSNFFSSLSDYNIYLYIYHSDPNDFFPLLSVPTSDKKFKKYKYELQTYSAQPILAGN